MKKKLQSVIILILINIIRLSSQDFEAKQLPQLLGVSNMGKSFTLHFILLGKMIMLII